MIGKIALVIFMMFLAGASMAHPGHGAPEAHVHWELWGSIVGLIAIIATLIGVKNSRNK